MDENNREFQSGTGKAMKHSGFTLIELMITIAILAILLSLAYPAYTSYVEKSRRADAISGILQAAQQMERCFTRSNTYTGCTILTTSPDGYYAITVRSTATTYSLSAAPNSTQAGDDCGTFTLDHRGIKGSGGSETDKCWGS